jgi:hypothetical protein
VIPEPGPLATLGDVMNARLLIPAPIAALVLAGCGAAAPTLTVEPAAAKQPAPASAAPRTDCDAGRWTGAIDPEGRPEGFDAGDTGAVYVWHDGDGWHVRSTDRRPTDHHYTGTIRLLPGGARFTAVRTVRDEKDDRVTVDGDNVLHYDLHTFASIDGFDFRVGCQADPRARRDRERLAFHTMFDGHPVADRVRIGAEKRTPSSADFGFVRSV